MIHAIVMVGARWIKKQTLPSVSSSGSVAAEKMSRSIFSLRFFPHIFGEQYFAVSQNNTLHIFSHGIQIEAAEVVPHQQPLGSSENQILR
jgi:hypothetical protein